MYDLVCVGDTTLDTFLKVHDAAVHCDLKTRECELCFRYGEKIPVEEVVQNPGGNAANVAVGTATLGVKTALYAIVGEDDIGEKVRKLIGMRGVDTKFMSINKGKGTNYSTIISFKGERTILEMKYPAKLSFTRFPKAEWVYLTSIKQEPKTVYVPLVRLKKQMGFKIAFNPGMYQLSHDSGDIVDFLRSVDVLIVNKEEAEMIVHKVESQKSKVNRNAKVVLRPASPELPLRRGEDEASQRGEQAQDDKEIIKGLYRIVEEGGLVFVTDGERGAWGYDGMQMDHCEKFPAKSVVDRTGAGDAFSSGVVAGFVRETRFPEVIRWGMANSAAALRKVGPQNGILDNREMGEVLRKIKIRPRSL